MAIEEMNFRRQPKRVELTLTGEKDDVAVWFSKLIQWASRETAAVDFDISPSSSKIIIHPWAVND